MTQFTVRHVLQRAAITIPDLESNLANRGALVDQLRGAAARLQEDAVHVLNVANKLAQAETVHTRMIAADQSQAMLSSILADLG